MIDPYQQSVISEGEGSRKPPGSLNVDGGSLPFRLIRVRLLTDWYACELSYGQILSYDFINGTLVPQGLGDIASTNDTATIVVLADPDGMINGELLAKTDDDGQLFLPKGLTCKVYCPEDSANGHYELLHAGVNCQEGSGSEGEGSEEEGSGEGSGEEGSGGSGGSECVSTLPPCPSDASPSNPYKLVCTGSCTFTWVPDCGPTCCPDPTGCAGMVATVTFNAPYAAYNNTCSITFGLTGGSCTHNFLDASLWTVGIQCVKGCWVATINGCIAAATMSFAASGPDTDCGAACPIAANMGFSFDNGGITGSVSFA